MTVVFGNVDDYLGELERDVENIDRKIVRTTYEYESSQRLPQNRFLFLRSTARVHGEVVDYRVFVGELWPKDFPDVNEPVEIAAREIETRIAKFCEKHALDQRGGRLE